MTNFDISCLPETIKEKLEKAGFISAQSIVLLSDHELRKQGNLTSEQCVLVRSHAAKSILNIGFMTVTGAWENQKEKWKYLTVGCKELDTFLHGGIQTCGVTEIAGESGCGKTQLCLQLSLTVQYPEVAGGLDGGAVYICTEDVFPSPRLQELFQTFPAAHLKTQENICFSDNIFIEHIGDVNNLKQCLSIRLPKLLSNRRIKLLVLDSIAGVFRADFDPSEAIARAKELQIVGSQLHRLSEQFQMAVVCVNQVSDVVSSEIRQQKCVPTLGLVWANMVTTRLQMSRTPHTVPNPYHPGQEVAVRTLEVVFAPHLPNNSCLFTVTRSGVSGIC